MKKIFILLILITFMGLPVSAQQGRGSQGDLIVDYYNHGSKTGHLIFNNGSGKTISKAHVRVTVLITWYEPIDVPFLGKTNQKNTKTLVLCDDDFYDISSGESKATRSQRGEVKGGPEKEGKTYQYNVEVKYATPFPKNGSINSSQSSSSNTSSSDGELIMRGEICHAMYKSGNDPAPSRITVDVYRTHDGKYYANLTSPESVDGLSIFKLSGSVYNGYVRYQNNSYGIMINDSRW